MNIRRGAVILAAAMLSAPSSVWAQPSGVAVIPATTNLPISAVCGISATGEILFNNAGVCDGDPGLIFAPTTDVLTVGGSVIAALFVSTGSGLTVANVGANSCGTSAATIDGGSNSFEITIGATAGTQCRVTFPAAAPTRWNCVANNQTTANLARSTPVSTTQVDILGTFTGADVVSVTCTPR